MNDSEIIALPLQLNHYFFQSREAYLRKAKRGGGATGHRDKKYTIKFFDELHNNYNTF